MAGKEGELFNDVDFSEFADMIEESFSTEPEPENNNTQQIADDDTIEKPEEDPQAEEQNSSEDTSSSEDINDDGSSPLIPYAKMLAEEGVLPNLKLEEFDGTADGLKKAMEIEINSGIDSYIESLPSELQHLINNYEEGVPLNRLLEIEESRFIYKSIPPEKISSDKELQKNILRDYYKNTSRFDDSKIEKLIQRSEDLDELTDEAKLAHTELIKLQDIQEKEEIQKAKIRQEEGEKQRQLQLTTLKDGISKKMEIIPGIKVNDKLKEDLFKMLTTPVAYDTNNTPLNEVGKYRLTNPQEFDIIISYLYKVTNSFKDWSVLNAAGKNSAIDEFEKAAAKHTKPSSGKTPQSKKETSDISDMFKAIDHFNYNK